LKVIGLIVRNIAVDNAPSPKNKKPTFGVLVNSITIKIIPTITHKLITEMPNIIIEY
jgi:hypothetical protein